MDSTFILNLHLEIVYAEVHHSHGWTHMGKIMKYLEYDHIQLSILLI